VQRLLLQAQTALNSYAEENWAREQGWPAFTTRLKELVRDAEPGSDQQLAFVNALASSVLDAETVALIAGWLDGSAPLPGLTVDTDQRWRLLHALVAHGKAGEAEIDAELARDDTATGRRQAARARALRPTAEAKADAWNRAVHDEELTNAISDSLISGFSHPGQKALLGEYVPRYFDVIDDVWQRRSSERAQPIAIGLYPSWAVTESTVAASDEWLAGEHPQALRRLVSEGRAGILRALAARDFDSQA
jgi:aminopeptidase N